MGIIKDSCCKKKEYEDIEEYNKKPRVIESEIGDKYCKGKVTIEIKESINKEKGNGSKLNVSIFKNQFHSDPMTKYKEIGELSSDLKVICLIDKTDVIRLMKIFPKKNNIDNKSKKDSFLSSAEQLQLLDNPNIRKIFEIYIFNENYYIIFEKNEENNLIEKIKDEGIQKNEEIRSIMGHLLNCIIYLHEKDIFNIELKLDTIFLSEIVIKTTKKVLRKRSKASDENKNENNNIKKNYEIKISVIDYLKEKYELEDVNTLIFYSPEIIEQIGQNNIIKKDFNINFEEEKKNYINNTYDEWACGIFMYYLISGEFPFKGKTKDEIISNIKNSDIDFSSPKFELISNECKDLITKLLEKDNNKRIKCNECFNHPFFTEKKLQKQDTETNDEIDIEILKNLLEIKKPASKFHELIIAYLCFNFIDKEEEIKLSQLFHYIDKDHNNILSEQDIKDAFTKNNIKFTEEQIKNILYVFDYDQNNLIQYQEFLRVLCNKEDLFKEQNLKNVFDVIDEDKNNYINADDIIKFVSNEEGIKNKVQKELMEPFGMKPENKMIFSQFCEIIKNDKLYPMVNSMKNKIKKAMLQKNMLEAMIKKENKEEK